MERSAQPTDTPSAVTDEHDAVIEAAEEVVLDPLADFPHIDLRAGVEPWEKRRAAGKVLRLELPHAAHATLNIARDRPDPVTLIEAAHAGRQSHLIPLRVARMASSPFAFLRGAAQVMAWDLAQGPRGAIDVVLNGDAHISNSGLFGSPQGEVVLDLNDFDEVTVGPWEWDLKRLCASIEVAARDAGVAASERRQAVLSAVAGYQHTMDDLAPRGSLDVWRRAARAEDLAFAGIEIDALSGRGSQGRREGAPEEQHELARPGGRASHGRWLALSRGAADPRSRR